jgi:hypothetical protein
MWPRLISRGRRPLEHPAAAELRCFNVAAADQPRKARVCKFSIAKDPQPLPRATGQINM